MLTPKEELIKELRYLANGGEPRTRVYGVCHHLMVREILCQAALPRQFRAALEVCLKSWRYHSGDVYYPVAHPHEPCPILAFKFTADLWKGEYGRRRRDLCRHVADYLENKL